MIFFSSLLLRDAKDREDAIDISEGRDDIPVPIDPYMHGVATIPIVCRFLIAARNSTLESDSGEGFASEHWLESSCVPACCNRSTAPLMASLITLTRADSRRSSRENGPSCIRDTTALRVAQQALMAGATSNRSIRKWSWDTSSPANATSVGFPSSFVWVTQTTPDLISSPKANRNELASKRAPGKLERTISERIEELFKTDSARMGVSAP
mmetsp:Transcript_10445/g.20577  ORF Transcript_10445/g.20577 Transcript_10445/m.20577 type:complete len:211 (-) Transcript_10445:2155-2787(-)